MENYFTPHELGSGIQQSPHSREAEEALLGSLLINPQLLQKLNVDYDDFYIVRNCWVFEAMRKLIDIDGTFDILTLTNYLEKNNQIEEIGGQAYLMLLVNNTPSSANIENYAKIIREKRQRRNLIATASEIVKVGYDEGKKVEDCIPEIMTSLTRNSEINEGAVHISKAISKLYDDISIRTQNPQDIFGIPTGFYDFDFITGGMQQGEMVVFAGDPSVGKTKLVTQIAMEMSKHYPGAFYEMEMKDISIVRRIISAESKVKARAMKTGKLVEGDWDKINEAMENISKREIYLSDFTHWTTLSQRADLAKLKAEHGIEWFVTDYMYLMQDRMDLKEQERLGIVGQETLKTCRDLDLAGLAIHSLIKPTAGGERELSHLRGSMQIGYEADSVYFIEQDKNPYLINILIKKFREDSEGYDAGKFQLRKVPGFPYFQDVQKNGDVSLPYKD